MKWTQEETVALIATYEHMLTLQSDGKLGPAASKGQTSKAAIVRDFIAAHSPAGRNRQSVEMKLMNISAARAAAGLPMVTGYKPLKNCSAFLTNYFLES